MTRPGIDPPTSRLLSPIVFQMPLPLIYSIHCTMFPITLYVDDYLFNFATCSIQFEGDPAGVETTHTLSLILISFYHSLYYCLTFQLSIGDDQFRTLQMNKKPTISDTRSSDSVTILLQFQKWLQRCADTKKPREFSDICFTRPHHCNRRTDLPISTLRVNHKDNFVTCTVETNSTNNCIKVRRTVLPKQKHN